jgi:general secretion pathway protein I
MNFRPRRAAKRTAGFTLIEILVAFAIAAVMLGAIYEVFANGVRSIVTIDHYRDAVLLSESALDALANLPIAAGDTADRIGIYERSTRIWPRPDLLPAGASFRAVPYEIEVQVGWREGIRQRAVSFSTICLAPPPT